MAGPNAPDISDLMLSYYGGGAPGNSGVTVSSGNKANAAADVTLPAVVGKTTYITSFDVMGSGSTAGGVILITVTGLLAGTLTYVLSVPVGALVPVNSLHISFPYPLPASTVNTAITVAVPAFGAGSTNAAAVAYGFQV